MNVYNTSSSPCISGEVYPLASVNHITMPVLSTLIAHACHAERLLRLSFLTLLIYPGRQAI